MVERKGVESEVRESVEVFQTGRWYIAEGEYDGRASATQGESKQEAIDKLVSKFVKKEKRKERREREAKRREEESKRRRERAEKRAEQVRGRTERYTSE